eukprot:1574404-Pyramimonas_sp.AAC.1
MLSVDIAITAEFGDPARQTTIDTWTEHILARRAWNTGGGNNVKHGAQPDGSRAPPRKNPCLGLGGASCDRPPVPTTR